MKYIIASDLHGSAYYARKIADIYKSEKANKLILLGDIYNHGPRNPFPKDYAPMQVAEILNGIKGDLIVVKGNCDSQVDTLVSDFDFIEDMCLCIGGKSLFLTHGHVYNKDSLPKTEFDGIIYGHFHTGFIERINGKVVVNTGSLSLPKNGTENSYVVIEDDVITLMSIDGKELSKTKI